MGEGVRLMRDLGSRITMGTTGLGGVRVLGVSGLVGTLGWVEGMSLSSGWSLGCL